MRDNNDLTFLGLGENEEMDFQEEKAFPSGIPGMNGCPCGDPGDLFGGLLNMLCGMCGGHDYDDEDDADEYYFEDDDEIDKESSDSDLTEQEQKMINHLSQFNDEGTCFDFTDDEEDDDDI